MSILKLAAVFAFAFCASVVTAAEAAATTTNNTASASVESCTKKVHNGCRAKNPGKHGAGAKGVKHHKHEKACESK